MVPRNFEPDRGDGNSGRSGHSGSSGRSGHSGRSGSSGHVQGRGRCVVPDLIPVRAGRRGRHRLRRIVYGRRRITAAGLAVAAAALAASAPRGDRGSDTRTGPAPDSASSPAASSPRANGRERSSSSQAASDRDGRSVSAPVRIADAGTVRLLRPGDRVDVIAGTDGSAPARLIAKGARVDRVPKYVETGPVDGALVVLRVPRRTATALAGAAVTTRLAVTLC